MGRPGSPDFFVFLKGGKCLHLEVKNEIGRQNVRQLDYEMKIANLGHRYCVVRSLEEVERLLNSGGIDTEKFENNFRLPKILLHVALIHQVWQYKPLTKEDEKDARNLSNF